MKKLFLSILILAGLSMAAKAQCDKPVRLSSSKTYYLDASSQVQGSKDENLVIDITKTTIAITPEGKPDDVLSGTIKEMSCDWKVPFKEGKMVIKTDLVDASGDTKDATITIEGKDGKITVTAEAKERPDQKMRLEVDKFEQKG